MASFLVRLWRDVLDRPCPAGGTPFRDVTGTAHEIDIACIYNLGITKGTSPSTYDPLAELTVSQIARFLLRTYEKAGMSCPSHGSELDEAVECLHSLRVIPSIEHGKSSLPVARSQMAVYVIGLWHNLAGRGLPPDPPGPFIDLVLPVPEESANLANVVTTGRIELPVYICAREGRYRIAHLRSATDMLNQRVAPFYREQSSGEVDMRFVTGGIVSPDLDWDGITLHTLWAHPDDWDPCSYAAIEQEGHPQLVMLVDVRPSVVAGFARLGVGPAVQPMAHHFWSEVRYLDVVAHEIGHSRFAFHHPHQRVGSATPLGEYHNERVYDPDDDSLMSYRGTNSLDTTHIACAQRAQAGWPPGPTLPNGQQCPGGKPGQDDSVPNPPRIVSVATADRQVTVRWEPPLSNRGWVWLTGYTVSVDDGRGPPDTRTVSDTRAIITGLTNGVTYTIRVTADNSVGSSQPAVATATPGVATTVPGAPVNVRVVEGDGELAVSWSPPSDDGGLPITEYNLWFTVGSAAVRVTLGPNELSYRIGSRPNGVPVTVWVRARNDNGEGPPSTRVTGTPMAGTTVPGQPVNVRVVEGDGELAVSWSPPSDDGGLPITGFVVTVDDGGGERSFAVGSSVGSYRVGNLSNGVPVTVWVRARNDNGEGPPSTGVIATPKAGAVPPEAPDVRAVARGNRIEASWTAADNGSSIDRWQIVGVGEVGAATTSYTWVNQSPGGYTVRVRAHNEAGWGPWGSTTVTIAANPTVTATKGNPGPTGGADVNDAPCAANDSSCRWINVTVDGFSPGSYTGRCIHEGFRWPNGTISTGGWWKEFTVEVGASGRATLTKPCYITFSALRGGGVHLSINHDGQWIDSNKLAPEANFVLLNRGGPGPTTAPRPGSIPCAANAPDCRWLQIQLRNFPQGTYRVYCAHDGFNNHPAGYWHSFETTIGPNGGATVSSTCYINFASTRGRGVIVRVGEAHLPTGQYQWSSNWLR